MYQVLLPHCLLQPRENTLCKVCYPASGL